MPAKEPRPHLALKLWILQLVVAAIAGFYIWWRKISTPHCDLSCNFGLLDTTITIYLWYCVVLVVAVGVFLLASRIQRWSWWVPLSAIVLTLIGAFVANYSIDKALLFI